MRRPNRTSSQRTLVSFLLLSCFLALPSLMLARADSSVPGISVGQWAHYTITGSESGGAVSSLFTVTAVNGSNVTFTDVDTQADGSNVTETVFVDMNYGPPVPSSGDYFLISPNKPVGESIYPANYHFAGNPPRLPIQDVSMKRYASANRQTVHVRAQNQTQVNVQGSSPYTYEDYYWDQSTGMFTEILKTLQGSPATLLHVVMDSTSIWPADDPFGAFLAANAILTFTSAGLVAMVVVGAVAIRRRKHR